MSELKKICSYCGDWFQCRDHVTPSGWLRVYRTYRIGETVQCCNQCNSLAGTFIAFSICEKAEHLIERYHQRFAGVMSLPEWSKDEIDELSGTLKMKIVSNQNLKELIYLKLDNLRLVAQGFEPVAIRDDALHGENQAT